MDFDMNIFFDCDYTLITWDGRLRPGVTENLKKLKEDGHTIYVWSGVGIRWLEVRRHGLEEYVTDCFHKPLFDYERRLKEFGVNPRPDIIIDDYLEKFQGNPVKYAHPLSMLLTLSVFLDMQHQE